MRAITWALTVCVMMAAAALADPVTLSAKRGAFEVTGELASFDGRYYRVVTEHGPVTLRAQAVTCAGAACPAPGETTGFTIAVAHSLSDVLVPALIRAFAVSQGLSVEAQPDERQIVYVLASPDAERARFPVRMRVSSASEAIAELAARTADIAIIDRSISASERTFLLDAGLGDMAEDPQETLLALDGLAVAVSPQRDEVEVGLKNLESFFAIPKPDWADLGFERTGPVAVTLRARGEDLTRLSGWFESLVVPIEYRVDAQAVAQSVRGDTERLGILPASAKAATRGLRLLEGCGLGHAPDVGQLAMGRYPWIVPIKHYVPAGRRSQELAAFETFLGSDTAARVVLRAGFARPTARTLADDLPERALTGLRLADTKDLARLQALVGKLSQAQQIGLSIPVVTESGPMRGVRRLAVQELARGLRDNLLPADRVLLLASAPSEAEARINVATILEEVAVSDPDISQSLSRIQIATDGALLPVACPGAPWAGWMNARVDVWLLPSAKEAPRPEN